MLVLLTSKCEMGCTHCMSNCTSEGIDMSFDTLELVCKRINEWNPRHVVLSGGEPTSHPKFKEMLSYVYNEAGMNRVITVASNGLNLEKEYNYLKEIKKSMPTVFFQITNVPNLYPLKLDLSNPVYRLDNVVVCTELQRIYPLGRAVTNNLESSAKCSLCFNQRLVKAQLELKDNLAKAINPNTTTKNLTIHNIIAALESAGKYCTMCVTPSGKLTLGESLLCKPYADITMTEDEILYNMTKFDCETCEHINRSVVDTAIYRMVKMSES